MKKIPMMLISILFISLTAYGQNLFFIGENSYPSTEPFALQSNLDGEEDVNVLFAKDGTTSVIAITTKSSLRNTKISGKLIIYLDDGTVITCIDKGESYYIDDTAKTVYSLTNEQVNKMKNSDINTVSFILKIYGFEEVNRSASNKGISTKDLIAKFFNNGNTVNEGTVKREQEPKKTKFDALMGGLNNEQREPNTVKKKQESKKTKLDALIGGLNKEQGQPNGYSYSTCYFGAPGSGNGGTSGYGLNGRSLVGNNSVQQDCNEEGRVVVKIVVDRSGKVISATPGVKGTTNTSPCLMKPAELTARSHSWKPDANAPSQQVGFVVVNFKLHE